MFLKIAPHISAISSTSLGGISLTEWVSLEARQVSPGPLFCRREELTNTCPTKRQVEYGTMCTSCVSRGIALCISICRPQVELHLPLHSHCIADTSSGTNHRRALPGTGPANWSRSPLRCPYKCRAGIHRTLSAHVHHGAYVVSAASHSCFWAEGEKGLRRQADPSLQ